MGDHAMLRRLEARRGDPARGVHARPRRDHRADHRERRPAAVLRAARQGRDRGPADRHRPAADEPDREDPRGEARCPARATLREARRCGAGPGRRRLLARVHDRAGRLLPRRRVRRRLQAPEPGEVRRVRGPPDLRDRRARRWRSSPTRSRRCATLQRAFAARTGVRNYNAIDGVSPGICHQVAREQFIDPGDFVQATDSHTCMGGASGALSWGVGATEYAALLYWGFTPIAVPESIRFELTGEPAPRRHGEGRDAPHPRDLREARGHAQPRDGVRRRGPVRAVARRARDAREHGDRVLGARRGDGGRRHDAALDRRAPARRARRSTRCARRS